MFSPNPSLRFLETKRASQVKNLPSNAGDIRDASLIPELGKFPRERHGNPLQYPCLENPMDRGAWGLSVPGVAKSRTQLKQLSIHAHRLRTGHVFSLVSPFL